MGGGGGMNRVREFGTRLKCKYLSQVYRYENNLFVQSLLKIIYLGKLYLMFILQRYVVYRIERKPTYLLI